MRLSAAVEEYLQACSYELGKAHSTVLVYRGRLRRFLEVVGDLQLEEATYQVFIEYYRGIAKTGVKNKTLTSHHHAIRGMFSYFVQRGTLQPVGDWKHLPSPAHLVKMPKTGASYQTVLSEEEQIALLLAADRQVTEFKRIRDKAVLSVFLFCGVRRQELMNLEVRCVNLKAKVLVVEHGKGDKRREIPLCQEVCEALSAWLDYRSKQKYVNHNRLFTVPGGRPLGENGVPDIVDQAARIAGIQGDGQTLSTGKVRRKVTPHALRHGNATRLIRGGADIPSLQQWLGHQNAETTLRYVHSSEASVRALADMASFQRAQEPKSEPPAKERTPERSQFFQSRRQARR